MQILIMGGNRFIGVHLTQMLLEKGHNVVLFNRGNRSAPLKHVKTIIGDRTNIAQLREKLSTENFDVIFDNSGRKLTDTKPLTMIFKNRLRQFIYMSSAGVYLNSDQMPYMEGDAIDPKSRHFGKYETEIYLMDKKFPYTSIRPTYIYGPGNYNDLEAWFFDRIIRDRPILIPGDGLQFTQLVHVKDLAGAMCQVLDNPQAVGQIYNVSGDRFITFDGLARSCAVAAGKSPDSIRIIHYDPKQFNSIKGKAFPLRVQHFFAGVNKAMKDLKWKPLYDLITGLEDSFENDYLAFGRDKADIDFSIDEEILQSLHLA
ncbi:NAD-dependent epimerase/dehydratase family protein [Richelia intracellularis]|nr:NAD-dependent epimerase/dehydratase family protein [Richelia intracellularis]HAE05908.1 3-beta hydroxysteroid dehydrogenase [Richelia sp.]